MRLLLLIAVVSLTVAHASLSSDVASEWQAFKTEHKRSYEPAEEGFRMTVFRKNRKMIFEHNELYEQGKTTFTMKMNRFGDLLEHEYAEKMNGLRYSAAEDVEGATLVRQPSGAPVPDTVDWRDEGAVTPAKDQGECGSCWSFSTTGSLEGQHFLKTGELVSLSEQNLVDCTLDYKNLGCGGGMVVPSFEYVKDNGGLDTEESYPYEGKNGKCRFDANNVGTNAIGVAKVKSFDEDALKEAVATVGPISIGMDASRLTFGFYSSGIYSNRFCDTVELDHSVLTVGYGTDDGQDYWLVKNSWGTEWGIDGFFKIARNANNMCGVATMPVYPLM